MSLLDELRTPRPARVLIEPTAGVPRYYLRLVAQGMDCGYAFAATRRGAERKARRMLRRHEREARRRAERWEVTP